MGFHVCEYCDDPKAAATSSGDVVLAFQSGRSYVMPDMIMHYVEEHGWRPPAALIDDVLNSSLLPGDNRRGKQPALKVGYLKGLYETGGVPPAFPSRLRELIESATRMGSRTQTRSA